MNENCKLDLRYIERIVLRIIQEHNGQYGWYQLDRALSQIGFVGVNVPSLISELVRKDFVFADGDLQIGKTRYTILSKGIDELNSQYIESEDLP